MARILPSDIGVAKSLAWSRDGKKQEWEAIILPGSKVGDAGCSLSFRRDKNGVLHFMAFELSRVDEDEDGQSVWPPKDLSDPNDPSIEFGATDMASGFESVEEIASLLRDPSKRPPCFGRGWDKKWDKLFRKPWVIESFQI